MENKSFNASSPLLFKRNSLFNASSPLLFKVTLPTFAGYSLFQLDKNISIVYKEQQRQWLHKSIQTPLSYGTCQRDGIMLPQRDTFLNAYKVLSFNMLLYKTKETKFQILNSTIWMCNINSHHMPEFLNPYQCIAHELKPSNVNPDIHI